MTPRRLSSTFTFEEKERLKILYGAILPQNVGGVDFAYRRYSGLDRLLKFMVTHERIQRWWLNFAMAGSDAICTY